MRGTGGQFVMLVIMNALLLVAGVLISGGSFLSLFNLQSMAGQVPEIGLLAIGVMLAMCAGNGGIDLSGIAGFATGAASLNFVSGFTGHAGDAILTYFAQTNQTSLMVDLTGQGAVDFAVGVVGQAVATDIVA